MASTPTLHLMFGKGGYKYDDIPGFFSVPYNFKPSELRDFIKNNIDSCRKNTIKFIEEQQIYDKTLSDLQKILPSAEITKKDPRDMNMYRYSIAIKHLIKYLQTTHPIIYDRQYKVERLEWIKVINKANNQILIGTKFKVFKDLSIEIPHSFKDQDFDEFLVTLGLKGGIYPYTVNAVNNNESSDKFKTMRQ